MAAGQIAVLGAVAGFTIFLGLPIGRLSTVSLRTRALLNATAVGVLVFLLWDVLAHAWEPVDTALAAHHFMSSLSNGAVLATGLTAGFAGLVYFDRWIAARRARDADGEAAGLIQQPRSGWRSPAGQLATLIAVGIGLHNFAEGLAIGNSAAQGEVSLALVLIVGFGLHNATEGFGIVAPLAAAGSRPSWAQLGILGLIGGGPTLVGTLVGQRFTNDTVSVAFLALAAGSILYVVIELLAVARKLAAKHVTMWGLLAGLLAGFVTDAVLTAAGA